MSMCGGIKSSFPIETLQTESRAEPSREYTARYPSRNFPAVGDEHAGEHVEKEGREEEGMAAEESGKQF